jgi:hypothetical protein
MIKLTPPQRTASFIRASDVALLKAAMEKRGFTATEEHIEYAYGEWCEQEYSAGWMTFGSSSWTDHAATGVIKWMRDQWWVETNV